jgi:SAM-dependent methyltransferase
MRYSTTGEWAAGHAPRDPDRVLHVDTKLLAAVHTLTGVCTPPPGSRAFDFGCGNGRWLDTLAAHGWETHGLDPALKTAFRRHSELKAIPVTPQFQFVVLSHVLEHLTNPGLVLTRLAAATLPGGWIYISVPSLDRLPEHRDWHYVINARAHLAAFSEDCLTALLERAGFGCVPVVKRIKPTRIDVKRLRIVAQRGGLVRHVQHPLDAALGALGSISVDP